MDAWRTFVAGLPKPHKPERIRPTRLVCFDLDGVLTEQESSWVAVHQRFGVRNGPGFEAFVNGDIDDEEFIRRDVALWLGQNPNMRLRDVHEILDQITLVPGAVEACRVLRNADVELAIVSGGLDYAAENVAHKLGIRYVSANGVNAHPDGRLTGDGYVRTPLRDKSQPLVRFATNLGIPLGAVAAVGNSAPDIPMFRSCGFGVAFRPVDSHTTRYADHVVRGNDLRNVAHAILSEDSV